MLSIDEHQDESGVLCLQLGGAATIPAAAALREALLAALRNETSVRLNLAGITQLDLSCLQLFCSAHHSALDGQKTLALDGELSGYVSDVLRCSGFGRKRGCARSPEPASCLWAGEMPEC
jgi:ABC-type transporter Mla MlaB component